MGKINGVSSGDRNRNARLAKLREYVPLCNAIVGIDLADKKQMVVVTDHDSKVLARRTFQCKAWDLGRALDWAAEKAAAKGFAGVTVADDGQGTDPMLDANRLTLMSGRSGVVEQPESRWGVYRVPARLNDMKQHSTVLFLSAEDAGVNPAQMVYGPVIGHLHHGRLWSDEHSLNDLYEYCLERATH